MYSKVTRHELLDQLQSRCNSSPTYNFGKCVETSMMAKVGTMITEDMTIIDYDISMTK